MKKVLHLVLTAFLMLIFLSTTSLQAQEWNKEQLEVWKVVEDTWMKWEKLDIEGAMENFHEQYQGWNADYALPTDKEKLTKRFNMMKEMMKITFWDLNPARITVTENAAVVNYYYELTFTMKMGEKTKDVTYNGKNVDFFVKDGGSWKLLGDFTAEEDND